MENNPRKRFQSSTGPTTVRDIRKLSRQRLTESVGLQKSASNGIFTFPDVSLVVIIMLLTMLVIGAYVWLIIITTTNQDDTIDKFCGLEDTDCDGIEQGDIIIYEEANNLFVPSNLPDPPETCNCSILTVENFQIPGATSPPCVCGEENCTQNRIWFCSEGGQFYYCDNSSDTWLNVGPPISLWGEQSRQCNFGNNPVTDAGCAMALGARALPSSGAPEYGLYMLQNFTIVSWGSSIDDQSECVSGSYDVLVCWSPGPMQDDVYSIEDCVRIGVNQTTDAANGLDLRVDIPGNRYIIWGLENNCNGGGSVNGMNIHLNIKYRMDT
jgi:hypothetical protein